jgi:FAD synthase
MKGHNSVEELNGIVRHYAGNGRSLGYPTANISTQTKLTDGVYFGYAELKEFHRWPSLIFIGIPTTVGDRGRRVEAHLLDIPDHNYYEKRDICIRRGSSGSHES